MAFVSLAVTFDIALGKSGFLIFILGQIKLTSVSKNELKPFKKRCKTKQIKIN